VLLGASRKSFLASLIQPHGQEPLPPHHRDHLTCAVSALAAAHGVWCIRAHTVVATRHALAVAQAITAARPAHQTAPALPRV
jgi:dihydropteroate synthase